MNKNYWTNNVNHKNAIILSKKNKNVQKILGNFLIMGNKNITL